MSSVDEEALFCEGHFLVIYFWWINERMKNGYIACDLKNAWEIYCYVKNKV